MKPIYIYSSCSISIQPTFQDDYFFEEISNYSENGIKAIDPDYKEFVPALQLRRMGKSMRMAVYAAQKAIQNAGNPKIDAVITGTGEGCLKDSEKFVEALWENEGGMLNPTPFIQSTHNMAAATVALALGCKGYNMTYTNNSNSFESALLDAQLYVNEHPDEIILIGGLDEISEQTTEFWASLGWLNSKSPQIPIDLNQKSDGEIVSEGAAFFVASGVKNENALGKILGLKTVFEVENPSDFILNFLKENDLEVSDLDAVILGRNGDDQYDGIYEELSDSIFKHTPELVYKNIYGEFDTVSSLAVETAFKLMEQQEVPEILHQNELKKGAYKRILIYNQRKGKNHGLILVEA